MSNDMREAIDAEVRRMQRLPDPADQVTAVGDFFAALDVELERLADLRLQAIAALRAQGLTYQQIADRTGLSYPRTAQLARDARAGGRATKSSPSLDRTDAGPAR